MRIVYEKNGVVTVDFSKGKLRAVKADGIMPYTVINSAESTLFDGGDYISSYTGTRKILLTLAVCTKDMSCISELNSIFSTSEEGVLKFAENGITKKISCYTEKLDFLSEDDPFRITVAFVCMSPFFELSSTDSETLPICGTIGLFEFDWEISEEDNELSNTIDGDSALIMNNGTSGSGCVITVNVIRDTENIRITNAETKEYIELAGVWKAGSRIVIDTRSGRKGIICTDDDVNYENVISRLVWGSVFFKLVPGKNRIYIRAKNGIDGLSAEISFTERFEGI